MKLAIVRPGEKKTTSRAFSRAIETLPAPSLPSRAPPASFRRPSFAPPRRGGSRRQIALNIEVPSALIQAMANPSGDHRSSPIAAEWTIRLVDRNIETLTDGDLQWADLVMNRCRSSSRLPLQTSTPC
jgi:hypothetical protein